MALVKETRAPGRPKSAEKRNKILSGAADMLLAHGYANTSMEAVAKASGVSKQTVYSHFNNKDALYNAIIEDKCKQYQIEEASICIKTQALSDILTEIGHRFIQLLMDKNVIAMYQLVIGEAKVNNHVAQLFYKAGVLHSIDMVSGLLQKHPQSELAIADAVALSHDFFNLLKRDFHMLSMLQLPYSMDEQAQIAHAKAVAKKTLCLLALIKQ